MSSKKAEKIIINVNNRFDYSKSEIDELLEHIKEYDKSIDMDLLLNSIVETGVKAIKAMGGWCCSDQVEKICKDWSSNRT